MSTTPGNEHLGAGHSPAGGAGTSTASRTPRAPMPSTPGAPQGESPAAAPELGRAQPPIRWPHPDRATVAGTAVWVLGLIVALLVPALIVSPTETNPPSGEVWTAFGCTLLGAAIMMAAATWVWRRSADASPLILGFVPAVACVFGGIILTATKLFAE